MFEQVKENIEVASKYEINSLNEDELNILYIARNEWLNIKTIGCTNCKYCYALSKWSQYSKKL